MIKSLYPCFQHWSEKGSVYLVSDTHFDDPDREYMGYTISSAEQYSIIKATVSKNDTLIHLGDVGNPAYIKKLPCYKVLIRGNHDENMRYMNPGENWDDYFDEVYSGPLIIAQKIILSHEPVDVQWALNIHGHTHNDETFGHNSINIVPNQSGYFPWSLKRIIDSGYVSKIPTIHRITIDKARSIHS